MHSASPLHRSGIFVPVSQEIARSRGAAVTGSIPVVRDTSSNTQIFEANKDFDKMESKKATLITLRIRKDAEGDNRNTSKPFYSELRLSDSSSLLPDEEHGDEAYSSDAYSNPDLSPSTIIQVVKSCLRPKYPRLLSPLPELLVPPSDQMNAFLGFVKGSSALPSSAVKVRVEPEEYLEKSYTLNGGEKKKSLQAQVKMKTAELESTLRDGVPKARTKDDQKNFIQETNADAHRNLHEVSNEYEVLKKVRQASVLDTRNLRQDAGLSLDATEISVHDLDPSKQQTEKESNVLEKPVITLKKEEGKLKLKDTTVSYESEKASDERQTPEILITDAKNMRHTDLLELGKDGQSILQRKEVYEASREAKFSQEEFSKLHAHDLGAGKLDIALGEEDRKDSCMKSSEVAKECKRSFRWRKKSLRLSLADTSKDIISDVKKDCIRNETSSKYPAKRKCSDFSEMKESSTDCLTDTYTEREGKKISSKKVSKQSASALETKAKDYARELEHEHVTTSEFHKTGMKNFSKDYKNDKFVGKEFKVTQEAEKDEELLEESAMNIMEVSAAKKNIVAASFSNSNMSNLDINTTKAIPAAPAGPATLVLDTWVECEKCGRWRLLLPEMDASELPKTFFCKMLTWLPGMNSCEYEQDETSDAVYKKLGIPNPRLAQLSASATHPQSASVQAASLTPAPFSSLNLSNVTEKPQETKRGILSKPASNKKAFAGKFPPGFSKSFFPRKGASGSVDSKKLNHHVPEDHDQAYQEPRVQGDEETKLSLLKIKRKKAKTSSAKELEGAPALKKTKMEEGRFCFLESLPSKSSSKFSAVFHESKKTESSAALLNTKNNWNEGTTGGVDCKRFIQSKALEEQENDHSLFNAGGTNAEKHISKVGDAKVEKKFKVRLKKDEFIQNEGKRQSDYEDSNSQFHNEKRMKHNKAGGTISRLCKGEIEECLEMHLRKECLPKDALQDQEQITDVESTEKSLAAITFKEASGIGQAYLKIIEPEKFIRGTSELVDLSGEAAAKIRRRQRSRSRSSRSSSSQVSSPEFSTRKSKGPVSPIESTVSSSPMKSHLDVLGPSKQRARSRDRDHHFPDVANDFRTDSGRDMGNFRAKSAYRTLLDERGCHNREYNVHLQDDEVSGDEHRGFRRGAESLRERDGRDGRYDRHNEDEWLQGNDCNRERDSHGRIFDKWASLKSCDDMEDKFAREKKPQDIRGTLSSGGSCSDQQFVFDRLDGMREGVVAGLPNSCPDGRYIYKDAICDNKQQARVKDMGAGKDNFVQSDRDIRRTAYRKEKSERLHWKEGKIVSTRQVTTSPKAVTLGKPVGSATGSKEGEAFVTRIADERRSLSNSESKIRIDQEKQAGNSVSGTKFKNHNGYAFTTQSAVNLKQARELSKRVGECVESRGIGPKKVSPVNTHVIREADVGGSSGMKGQPMQQANCLIKDAKDLKHTADRFKGSGAFRGDLYLHAALKFLQGAAILETCQDGGAKRAEILSFYSGTAKLCEFCATLYAKDIQATALALKCAAVARMRELAFKNPSTSRNLAAIQATLQLPNPSSLGESPSSSASDIDNLNNQTFPDGKLQSTNTLKEVASPSFQASAISSIPATAWHHPNVTRFLRDTGEICAAFEAWRKADLAYVAAKVKFSDISSGDAIKRVGEIGFSDVEVLVQLVKSALKALRG
ncbi:hypothetical protein O6H91_Y298000 [Diphasiastrum complanatum]|nr:hypothetical protein O6H91_Y298000 [Diphasiastrum complanatum]